MSRPAYLDHTLYRDPVDEKKLAFLIGELEKLGPAPLDILETGCGSGNIALPVASLGHRVIATDIDGPSLDFIRARNRFPNLILRQEPLDAPQPRAGYDAIIVSEVLEHVEAPEAALAAFRRALKPGGILLVTIPNGYGPWEIGQALSPRRLAGWLARRTGTHGALKRLLRVRPAEVGGETSGFNFESPHLQHFTLPGFRRMAESAGLSIRRRGHSDGPLTFFSSFRHVRALARFDCRVVDHLPPSLASGWYFVLEPRADA